jgi:phosphatidylserine/phosphatidylglycerophosphate/cardiolipin synthase-like enzyme
MQYLFSSKLAGLGLLLICTAARPLVADDRIHVLPPPADIPLPSNVAVFFAPGDNLENAVVAALDQARTEILINQEAITSKKIGEAIVRAYHRKVVVGMILAEHPPIEDYQAPAFFDESDVPFIYAVTTGRHDQRYCVIDRRLVLTGSYEWLALAGANNENLLIVDEPGLAAAYARDWLETSQRAKTPSIP